MRSKSDFPLTLVGGIFVCAFLFSYAHGIPDYSGLPPGPYCKGRYPAMKCCEGRQDECSAPILGTTCYCDDFCNRSREEDCCPDYWSHCAGEAPAASSFTRCYHEGKYYDYGKRITENCNKCKCSAVEDDAVKMICEKNRCLVEQEILDEVNLQRSPLQWNAANYSEFWGRTLVEGIQLRLGTLNPSRSVTKMNPVRGLYNPDDLPKEFNAQFEWRNLISPIRDQGWCGASWALSTVDVASDRYAIMSKGAEAIHLAAQHLISCNNRGQQGCKGGYLDKAWVFMRKFGLVDEDCYPWIGADKKCKLPKRTNLITARCNIPTDTTRTELYKVGPVYRLGNETDIMHEILSSGPVQATMKVYQDFFVYKSGIYKHSRFAEVHRTGYHSVRIVGWGQEITSYGAPIKYWIVANSWGSNWGENGFFRIVRGVNECEIESFVLAAWATTAQRQ